MDIHLEIVGRVLVTCKQPIFSVGMCTSSEMNAAVSGCLIVMTESSDVVSAAVSKCLLLDWSGSESNTNVSCLAGSR